MAWGLKDKELGLTRKQRDSYSIGKALAVLANPHSPAVRKEAGFELDLSDQICKRDNRESKGIIIPQEILDHGYRTNRPMPRSGHILTDQVIRGAPPPAYVTKRAMSPQQRMHHRAALMASTPATAGNLIDTELQSVVTVLVENTLGLQNIPTYNVMGDPVYFPRQTSRVQASWGTEGVGPIIAAEDLASTEFSSEATQSGVTALSGTHWAVITINNVKYLAFKTPDTADEAILKGLEVGRQIEVYASGGTTALTTFTIGGAYNDTNDRIQINSDADVSSLTDGDSYDLKTVEVTAESNPTFDRVQFSARYLKCLVPITRTLLLQADADADDLIRGDIAIGIAKALDTAIFYGTGSNNNQPQGIKGTSDIVSVTWSATEIYDKVLDTWAQIGVQNVPSRNLKWIGSWRFCHDAKRATKLNNYASDEQRVLGSDGTIDGVPVEITSQIVGTNAQKAEAFLADWMEGALVFWQDLEVEIEPYSQLDKGIVRFISNLICDFNVTRPKAFGRLGA